MLSLLAAFALAKSEMITVDPSVKLQKWDGWGTSLAWWGNVVGQMPAVRDSLTARIFGYLKLNIVRYNIGGGENPAHRHMWPRAQMEGFLDAKGKWDWSRDAGQRWVLQRAKQLGANRFEAFSNSPPYFMTISKCASGGRDGKPNLPASKVDAFADYLATVCEHFRTAWGISFETLEPMNEPSATWWKFGGKQEGCRVPAGEEQSRLIEAVGHALAKRHSKTHVSASDENDFDTAVKSWDALSPEAKGLVWRIDTHAYSGTKQKELLQRAVAAKKELWVSEEGEKDSTGWTMAERIIKDLREMMPTAWIDWQAIDQTGSGWGFIDMDVNGRKPGYVENKKLYVFANFSRFIAPGSRFVSIDDDQSISAIEGDKLVIVTLNRGAERFVHYDLSRFGRLGALHAYRTSAKENLAEIDAQLANGARLDMLLPEGSITTIVVERPAALGRSG
ncbi:MAG TPA: glycoside hydrolase [Fimbriimonadaceae bacterium]|nr:glycoside hydrolase [Fimbriimonadaceae bacterium]